MCRDSSTARPRILLLLIPILLLTVQPDSAAGQNSSKVSPLIRLKKKEIQAQVISRRATRAFDASLLSNKLVKVDGDRNIHAYIRVDTFGSAERAKLEAYRVKIEVVNEDYGIIQAWIPFDLIDVVAQLPFVKLVTPPSYAVTRTGSVTTEGDAVLNADQLRALGFDGTGVRVGVISDGVDSRAVAQATGDLPATITIQTYAGSGDEGTAMLEIVHDLAPGAELAFCGPATSLEMVTCVNNLAGVFGADIIVDDLGFPGEPFFEDGPVANTVAGIVASGVFYTSSAGNDAENHYQGGYVDSLDGWQSHEISPGNNIFNVTGASVDVVVQWSNQFGFSGDDYDLCLDTEDPTMCAGFNGQQDGDDYPIEFRTFTCPGPGGCNLQVRLVSGGPQTIEVLVYPGATLAANDQVAADSIYGHAAVPGVVAAAAVDWFTPDTIETFSSRGPATIRFPATEIRQKPDLTATDWVSITGAGGFGACYGLDCYFPGTSASSPHIAGVAALLMSGGRTASAVRTALTQTAVDLGPAGRDTTYGYGRIDALAANAFLSGSLQFSLLVDDDGGGGSNNFCFIDTAAHGSPVVLQFDILKNFLDRFLHINRAGGKQ